MARDYRITFVTGFSMVQHITPTQLYDIIHHYKVRGYQLLK